MSRFLGPIRLPPLNLNLANDRHCLRSYASASGERLHHLRSAFRRIVRWL